MRYTVLVLLLAFGCEHDHSHGDTGEVLDLIPSADATRGQTTFGASCANENCHGTDGDMGPAPDLSIEIPEHNNEELAGIIRNGQGNMPALSEQLNDQNIADVIVFVRGEWPSN